MTTPSPARGCTVPPAGWWCSRGAGHEGPCAARPDSEGEPDQRPTCCEGRGGDYQCPCRCHKASDTLRAQIGAISERVRSVGMQLGSQAVPKTRWMLDAGSELNACANDLAALLPAPPVGGERTPR